MKKCFALYAEFPDGTIKGIRNIVNKEPCYRDDQTTVLLFHKDTLPGEISRKMEECRILNQKDYKEAKIRFARVGSKNCPFKFDLKDLRRIGKPKAAGLAVGTIVDFSKNYPPQS